jgi:hypothetical protein
MWRISAPGCSSSSVIFMIRSPRGKVAYRDLLEHVSFELASSARAGQSGASKKVATRVAMTTGYEG